jgi:hypothetical protein
MISFALDAVTSCSTTPIRIVTSLDFVLIAFCVVLGWTVYIEKLPDTPVRRRRTAEGGAAVTRTP